MAATVIVLSLIMMAAVSGALLRSSYAFTDGQSAHIVIGQQNFSKGNSFTNASSLWDASGVAFDSSGNLWVADTNNNRVLEFPEANFAIDEVATIEIGQSNMFQGGAADTPSGFSHPKALTFDSSGDLWVSDSSNNRILEFVPPFSNAESASLVLGQPDFIHGGAAAGPSSLSDPMGIAFDSSGDLWVADQGNSRVLEFKPPFTDDQAANLVLGQPDFVHYSGATSSNGFDLPAGVAFDSSGDLWVADQGNNRILEFTPTFSTDKNASLVIGQSSFTSALSGTSPILLDSPTSVAIDSLGDLWITDTGNNRILEYTPPPTDNEAASLVIGQFDFRDSDSATTATGLTTPLGISFDPSGDLWMADSGNNRVLEFVGPAPTSTTQTTSTTVTSTFTASTTSTVTRTTTLTTLATSTTTLTVTSTAAAVATSFTTLTTSQTVTTTTTSTGTTTRTFNTTQTTTLTSTHPVTTTKTTTLTVTKTSTSLSVVCIGSVCLPLGGLNFELLAAFLVLLVVALVLLTVRYTRGGRTRAGAGRPAKEEPRSWTD